jgi:hypothetical protein
MITKKISLFLLCFLLGNNLAYPQISKVNPSNIPHNIDSLELALKEQVERIAKEGRHSIMYVAQCLAQGTTTDGLFDYEFLHQILEALEKIRAAYPEVKNINPRGGVHNTLFPVIDNNYPLGYRYPWDSFSIRDIFVGFTTDAAKKLLDLYPKKKNTEIDSTGIKNIDALNRKLGVKKLKLYKLSEGEVSSLVINYKNYHDVLQLLKMYESFPEVKYSEIDGYIRIGPPDQIYLLKKNEGWYFAFCKSRGETWPRKYYIFYYSPVSKTLKKMLEFLPPCKDFESNIWLGIIDRRFALKPFQSYHEILKTAKSKKWWHRLYALNVLGNLMLPEFSLHGEDNQEKTDTIQKDVLRNRKKVVKILLDNLNNEDHDISMTAYTYLRLISKEEYKKSDIEKWKTWYNHYKERNDWD